MDTASRQLVINIDIGGKVKARILFGSILGCSFFFEL